MIAMLYIHFMTRSKMREQKFSVGDSSLNTRKAKTLQFDTVVWEAVKSTVIRTFFFIFFRAELKLDTT